MQFLRVFFPLILFFGLSAQSMAQERLEYCVSVKKMGHSGGYGYDIFCNQELVETIVGSVEGVKSKYGILFEFNKSFFSENLILFSNDQNFSDTSKICVMAENRFKSGGILDYLPGLQSEERLLQRLDCGSGTREPIAVSAEELISQSLETTQITVRSLLPEQVDERDRFKHNINLKSHFKSFTGIDDLSFYY